MLSVSLRPKEITLSGFHCNFNRKLGNFFFWGGEINFSFLISFFPFSSDAYCSQNTKTMIILLYVLSRPCQEQIQKSGNCGLPVYLKSMRSSFWRL